MCTMYMAGEFGTVLGTNLMPLCAVSVGSCHMVFICIACANLCKNIIFLFVLKTQFGRKDQRTKLAAAELDLDYIHGITYRTNKCIFVCSAFEQS